MFVTLCLNPTIQKTLCFDKISSGEVNRASRNFTDASGKGINVSRVLAQLGKQVLHVTQLSKQDKLWFEAELEKQAIKLLAIETAAKARTCATLIEENSLESGAISRCVTELVESGNKVEPETEAALLKAFDALLDGGGLQQIDSLIISGSKAPGFRDSLFAEIALKAHAHNVPVVLDIRGADLKELLNALRAVPQNACGAPLIVKPNAQELKETFFEAQAEAMAENQINDCIAKLYSEYGVQSVITRGKDSTLAFDGKKLLNINSESIPQEKVLNTIGCGDAFTAGFAAALADGSGFEAAIRQGIKCAAQNAMTIQPGSIK
ncbi:MAG: bifunctional hydroxymethylpyrimidine kinase/phosphomethylpyrimidine kinase [Spirochaetaceae bacterium]|nr:bifunctional hydroxymethylpyrimidine kinase/phosphomethylpyrimidine kinase [Spirochaetaceae bacterium]